MAKAFRTCLTIVFALVAAASYGRAESQPWRPSAESFITQAVYWNARLWLLTDSGTLSVIEDGANQRIVADLPEPAQYLWLYDGGPAVITCVRENCENWTLRRLIDDGWISSRTVASNGEHLVAAGSTGATAIFLTSERIIEITDAGETTLALTGDLGAGLVTTAHVSPDAVFVGFNLGEWGGGMQRIDRVSGDVSTIERNLSGDLCGGPLNTGCDPVNGIVEAPWDADCIAAAIGLVHFAPRGRIVEICDGDVETHYFKGYPDGPEANRHSTVVEPFSTVAFFGLTTGGENLLATGIDGIYRIMPDGTVETVPMPQFEDIDGVYVSFELPEIVLVLTSINMRVSLSGSVPMLVPR